MNPIFRPPSFRNAVVLAAVVAGAVTFSSVGFAQPNKKNPASKIFVSDVNGEAQIDTGENIQELNKRAVYTVQGTVIETKKAEREDEKSKNYSTMVYSNGTGAYFAQDTRVEVKKFVQEPFTPNRSDMEVEPSISQTQAFVAHGTVGLCTSKLVAGSNMNYQTSLGQVNIRGQKVVIEANDDYTKISMLDGESTVKSGAVETGGQTVRAGEQAIIRRGRAGQAPQIQIMRIPPAESQQLGDKVAEACKAKKTVYFEVKERQILTSDPAAKTALAENQAQPEGNTGAGGETPTSAASGAVTAFDSNSGTVSTSTTTVAREIVAVPVVPTELPVKFTVSPASVTGPGKGGGG